ncbi:MAG: sugar kinase [Candidatus Helarchaeota archaeon]
MVDVIALGEAMLRISPKNYERLEFSNEFDLHVGGTEANFCIGLSRLGIKTSWISKLTNNSLGKRIENEIKRWGVDTTQIIWTDKYRVGLYFFEKGSYPRPSNVIYDRKNSAVCYLEIEELDWNYILQAKLFHTTGITLALSDKCKEVASECLKIMKKEGRLTSFDINYRSKLWNVSIAKNVITSILNYVDILFTSEDDLFLIFGKGDLVDKCKELIKMYKNKLIVVTRGGEKPFVLDDKGIEYYGTGFRPNLIDRIGAGDAFNAGFIYGYLKDGINSGLQYGEAMSALKFSIPGDFAILTKEEIEYFIKNKQTTIKR